MDRGSGEVRVDGWARALALASSTLCTATSVFYLAVLYLPIANFFGLVNGYYSFVGYGLSYLHSGERISLANTEYVRLASAVFTVCMLFLLALSMVTSVLVARERGGRGLLALSGVVYGIAASHTVSSGVLRYLYQAFLSDLAQIARLSANGGAIVLRTSAGVVEIPGVSTELTAVHSLLANPLPLLVLLTASMALSATALSVFLARYAPTIRIDMPGHRSLKALALKAVGIAIALAPATAALASVYVYYPIAIEIRPSPPPVTLEQPPYTYTCTALTRTARGALAYTDFETYPLTGWTDYGGTWSSVSGVAGAKGNVLQGTDNGRGLGDASQYYYNTDLSTYTSLWVAVKTRFVSRVLPERTLYYGIAMLNSARTRVYAVVLEDDQRGIEIRSYGVTAAGWARHVDRRNLPWYSSGSWYTIVVRYSVLDTTISIEAYFYDSTGSLLQSESTSITHQNVFVPAYIGVIADGLTAQYDEFIISTSDPRNVLFSGLAAGMRVEVWDNLGSLVSFGTAPGATLTLSVVHDFVVGTGVDGRVVVGYPDSFLCLEHRVPAADAILGGDSYGLSTWSTGVSLGANRTSASVSLRLSGSSSAITRSRVLRLQATQTVRAMLNLSSVSAPPTLNLNISLVGSTTSTPIRIVGGSPVSRSTSVVLLNLGPGNHIAVEGFFGAAGQSATIDLSLVIYTGDPVGGAPGAIVVYPIRLLLSS